MAADHLGLTLREFFNQYLAVDYWEADHLLSRTNVLSPAVVGAEAGAWFPENPNGRCVFFNGGRCDIHEVKPFECRTFVCTQPLVFSQHLAVAAAWGSGQDQIRELLDGRDRDE